MIPCLNIATGIDGARATAPGPPLKPSFASTGLTGMSFAFEMQSGMGEVVVTPIYRVLEKRGVKFQFFMKLKRIELDSDEDFGRENCIRQTGALAQRKL